jgi:hypothetical protein
MSVAKQFHGPLEATSKGAMLTAVTEATGAEACVAIERVSRTLDGQRGTFALMHNGTMAIEIVDKKHLYDFACTLPANS